LKVFDSEATIMVPVKYEKEHGPQGLCHP
jgi:hypothetical protein